MNISLTKFCKDHALPKSTVYRRCGELNIDTSDGVSPADCDRLLHEFDVTPALEKPVVTVEVGNHQLVLATPQLPTAFSLESLRTVEAVTIADPLGVAAEFLQLADQITNAMQQDIQQRQQRVQQTTAAKDAIAEKAQQLQLESRLYQLQTQQLDTAQTQETEALSKQLAALQRLGKPAES